MNQEEFSRCYDGLLKFAFYKAGRSFRDFVQREEAAIEAVNSAVDLWLKEDCYDLDKAKQRIESFLRHASRQRELDSSRIIDTDREGLGLEPNEEGYHGYKLIS